MAIAGSKRSRKPNIKQEKLSVLVDEVEKTKQLYSESFPPFPQKNKWFMS